MGEGSYRIRELGILGLCLRTGNQRGRSVGKKISEDGSKEDNRPIADSWRLSMRIRERLNVKVRRRELLEREWGKLQSKWTQKTHFRK